jgi:hypothetical protein
LDVDEDDALPFEALAFGDDLFLKTRGMDEPGG